MKNSLRLLAVSLAALFLFSGVAYAAPDAKELLKTANEKLATAESFEVSQVTKLDLRAFGEKLVTTSTVTQKYLRNPLCLQIKVDAIIPESSSVYVQEENGGVAVYISTSGGVTREEGPLETFDLSRATKMELDDLLKKYKNPIYAGTEKINKKPAHVLHASVAAIDIESIILRAFSTTEQRKRVRSTLKGMEDLAVKICIDEATGQFARIELDMADMMQELYKIMVPDSMNLELEDFFQVKECSTVVNYKDINAVKPFSVPKSIVRKAR